MFSRNRNASKHSQLRRLVRPRYLTMPSFAAKLVLAGSRYGANTALDSAFEQPHNDAFFTVHRLAAG